MSPHCPSVPWLGGARGAQSESGMGRTSAVSPVPAGASAASSAGAAPPSVDPVQPPPGAVSASVVVAASERPSGRLDVLGVWLLLLFLAPLLWSFTRTPCAVSDHGDRRSGTQAAAGAGLGSGGGGLRPAHLLLLLLLVSSASSSLGTCI